MGDPEETLAGVTGVFPMPGRFPGGVDDVPAAAARMDSSRFRFLRLKAAFSRISSRSVDHCRRSLAKASRSMANALIHPSRSLFQPSLWLAQNSRSSSSCLPAYCRSSSSCFLNSNFSFVRSVICLRKLSSILTPLKYLNGE